MKGSPSLNGGVPFSLIKSITLLFLSIHPQRNICTVSLIHPSTCCLGCLNLTFRTERDMALEERSWDSSLLRCSLWVWDSFFMSLNLSHMRNWVDICQKAKSIHYTIFFHICNLKINNLVQFSTAIYLSCTSINN